MSMSAVRPEPAKNRVRSNGHGSGSSTNTSVAGNDREQPAGWDMALSDVADEVESNWEDNIDSLGIGDNLTGSVDLDMPELQNVLRLDDDGPQGRREGPGSTKATAQPESSSSRQTGGNGLAGHSVRVAHRSFRLGDIMDDDDRRELQIEDDDEREYL